MEGRANKLASGADGRTSGTAVWVGSVGGGAGGRAARAPAGKEGVKRRRAVPAEPRGPLGNLPVGAGKGRSPVSARSPVIFSFSCLGLKERGEDWDRVRAGLLFLPKTPPS